MKQEQPHLVLSSYEESPERLKEAHRFLLAHARELGLDQPDLLPAIAPTITSTSSVSRFPAASSAAPTPEFDVFRVSVMSSQPRPGIEASPVEIRLASLKNRHEELLKATLNVQRAVLALRPGPQFNPRRFARAIHRFVFLCVFHERSQLIFSTPFDKYVFTKKDLSRKTRTMKMTRKTFLPFLNTKRKSKKSSRSKKTFKPRLCVKWTN